MSVSQKIEDKRRELETGQYRSYTIRERIARWFGRKWQGVKDWMEESKFFCSFLVAIICISGTVCFYEGQALRRDYLEAMGYWESYQARKTIHIVNEVEASGEPVEKQVEAQVETRAEQLVRLVDLIWSNESSRGRNNFSQCEIVGQVNEIGYAIPGDGSYICFENRAEQSETLVKWLEKHFAEGMSEQELLCHYSGSNYAGCPKK